MKIGIIGAGNIGATLARKFSAAGHQVKLTAKEADVVAQVASEAKATATDLENIARDVEVLVVSVPFSAMAELASTVLAKVPSHVVVVDTGNYYPGMRDQPIAEIEAGLPETEWVARQLGRPAVKAFNSLLAYSLANKGLPSGAPGRIAMAVAGDDTAQKKIVMGLVNEIGFDPVDAGTIAQSWRFQPGTPAYCVDVNASDLSAALQRSNKERAPQLRDLAITKFSSLTAESSNDDVLAINRSLHQA